MKRMIPIISIGVAIVVIVLGYYFIRNLKDSPSLIGGGFDQKLQCPFKKLEVYAKLGTVPTDLKVGQVIFDKSRFSTDADKSIPAELVILTNRWEANDLTSVWNEILKMKTLPLENTTDEHTYRGDKITISQTEVSSNDQNYCYAVKNYLEKAGFIVAIAEI